MAKLLLFFALASVAMTTGCAKVDKGCEWEYIIQNQTTSNVSIMRNGEVDEVISPREEQVVYHAFSLCNADSNPPVDLYKENDMMHLTYRSDVTVQIKAGEELMPEIIFLRKYWDYAAVNSNVATYTLILTDELIETIKNQQN